MITVTLRTGVRVTIDADSSYIGDDNGVLTFTKGGVTVAQFAPGGWDAWRKEETTEQLTIAGSGSE